MRLKIKVEIRDYGLAVTYSTAILNVNLVVTVTITRPFIGEISINCSRFTFQNVQLNGENECSFRTKRIIKF